MKIGNPCIFCNLDVINEGLLDETKNFYHRANMKGAIAPGHSMIISKKHFSCFGEMPLELWEEYSDYKQEIGSRIRESFGELITDEQGIHAQSVNHAHLHFFPRTSEWYDFSKKDFISFVPEEIPITEVEGIRDICEIFRQEGQYVSLGEHGQLYVCHTNNYSGELRPARDFPSELTGNNDLLYWQAMSRSEEEKNQEWIRETIEKLKRK